MKKDFGQIQTADMMATAGDAVKDAIERTGAGSDAAGPIEAQVRAELMRTRGRKGCKAKRINMAFAPNNHDFIRTVSAAAGMSMTELVNRILDEYRADHADLYQRLQGFADSIMDESDGGEKDGR